MSRYAKSPPKTTTLKPQIIGNCDIPEKDQAYIQNLIQKLYKSPLTSQTRQNLQKQVSQDLCKYFQKSVGVSIAEGDESYLSNVNTSAKREPTMRFGLGKMRLLPIISIFKQYRERKECDFLQKQLE